MKKVKVLEKKDGLREKEGRRGGGDWGDVSRLPPWMWQETKSSERFRATGDTTTFSSNHILKNFLSQRFRATGNDKLFAKLYPKRKISWR